MPDRIREGAFREDLYYRLNVVPIEVPPLRERREDIPLLVAHFLLKYNAEIGKKVSSVHPSAMELLTTYSWSGNVRELENAIERAVVLAQGNAIAPDDLSLNAQSPEHHVESGTLTERVEAFEKQLLWDAYLKANKVKADAAKLLDIERTTFRGQMARESSELLLSLDVAPVQTDGPDEIQQKLAVLQDQQDIIRAKIGELDRQIRETGKALDLRRNMLELLRDIRRGEEDEFDLDRNLDIAELEGEIADAESVLEIWRAKRESWYAREKIHGEKAVHLASELENMLKGK